MNIEFEHAYQQKVMMQRFRAETTLASKADVAAWRSAWTAALASWHSPYKALIDCSNLTVGDDEEVKKALELMMRFFTGFHLRKAVGFGLDAARGHEALPFQVHAGEAEALIDVGMRQALKRDPTDFRGTIQLQNHFQTHVVELNFSEPVVIASKEQVQTLKSKLTNNLMQWHSKWSLLIDCANLEVGAGLEGEFDLMFRSLRGFFMKHVIGYAPRGPRESYPFPVFRARHKAVAELEGEGNFSGDKADCRSRQA